jgi:hypothetical protein
MTTILDVKRAIEHALLGMRGVSGVGINWADQTIRVYVESLTPAIDAAIPENMSGFPIEVIETGMFSTRDVNVGFDDPHRRARWRPAYGGVSAGHFGVTAGTIGGVVMDSVTGENVMLSNNHVFANCTTVLAQTADIGDIILQPAWHDAGSPADGIATLERWIPLNPGGDNLVDCAIARPIVEGLVDSHIIGDVEPDGSIVGISPRGVATVSGGEIVHKYGRTTGHTSGEIIDADFTTVINYPGVSPMVFVDQILACIRVDGGDSGSFLLDDQNRVVGVVVASAKSGGVYYTIANKIRNVMAMLGVEIPDSGDDIRIPGFDAVQDPVGAANTMPSLAWVAAGTLLGAVVHRAVR